MSPTREQIARLAGALASAKGFNRADTRKLERRLIVEARKARKAREK